MTERPLVSIVLPTYDGSRYIARSIESCLGQTHRALELIIVDGGSRDATRDIVHELRDPRVKIVEQPGNRDRLPGALNLGFAHALGEYHTWTQDDDYFEPEAIEVMVGRLEADPGLGMVYAGMWCVDEHGAPLRRFEPGPPGDLRWTNPVGHCFLYRAEVARRVGGYDPRFLMAEDNHYWMRISRLARMERIAEPYASHRLHPGSLTMRDYGRYLALRVSARARREVLGIGWSEYQRQVAAAFIEEAFAAYQDAVWGRVRRCVLLGLLRDPSWIANRGVLSIGVRSLARSPVDLLRSRTPAG